ncbi:MAG: 4-(cytidine 5'-diphospho)-2-C-methyl-D-erythritol kinase, partial [Mycoplasmatales bacterium]
MVVRQRAYAKINLVLNVLSKRVDGYHEVDFLMTSVKLFDLITVQKNDVDIVICEKAPFIQKEKNLAYKAWILMKDRFKLEGCVKITIDKVIPVSAGMAGGSADCAATIKCINKLFDLKLSFVEMSKIGAELGSDVPFCIYSKLSRATGRGEKIKVISKKLPHAYLVIVNPSVGLSTPRVFKNHILTHAHGNVQRCYNAKNFEDLCNNVHNDLE